MITQLAGETESRPTINAATVDTNAGNFKPINIIINWYL